MTTRLATPPALRPDEAVPVLGVIFVLFHLGAAGIGQLLGAWSLGLAQWLFIALPIVLLLRLRGLALVPTLRLNVPPHGVWGPTAVLSLGVIGAATLYMAAQEAVLGRFDWYQRQMEAFAGILDTPSPLRLLGLLFAVAVTAAICEEMLFRGYLLRALEPALPRTHLCIATGVLFGLFHASPLQLVPAALIGAVLSWLALATNSLWPPILMHLLFNTATLLSRFLLARGVVSDDSPALALLAAVMALVCLPLGSLWFRLTGAAQPSPSSVPDSQLTIHAPGGTS